MTEAGVRAEVTGYHVGDHTCWIDAELTDRSRVSFDLRSRDGALHGAATHLIGRYSSLPRRVELVLIGR